MQMEWPGLVLGIGFALSLYALKTGMGLQYYLEQEPRWGRRLAVFLGFLITYGLLFAGLAVLVHHWEPGAHFQYVRTLFNRGMVIHSVMAALMLLWGLALLKTRNPGKKKRLGWLALVIPCPVCLTVVFLSVAVLASYVPEARGKAVAILYGGFLTLGLLSLLLTNWWRRRAAGSPEAALGAAMVVMSAYFILSVIIMPQFSGLDEAFRLSASARRGGPAPSLTPWVTGGVLGVLFMLGFTQMRARTRRSQ